ncbi:unnamed protein product [Schistosoma haematobium]|nr:unnamed protein product [Schistosoma haematobium]
MTQSREQNLKQQLALSKQKTLFCNSLTKENVVLVTMLSLHSLFKLLDKPIYSFIWSHISTLLIIHLSTLTVFLMSVYVYIYYPIHHMSVIYSYLAMNID